MLGCEVSEPDHQENEVSESEFMVEESDVSLDSREEEKEPVDTSYEFPPKRRTKKA